MRLHEITTLPSNEYNPKASDFKIHPEVSKEFKQIMKPLPGGSGLTYVVRSGNYSDIRITILDPQDLSYRVGTLTIDQGGSIPENTWQAVLINVHPKYRGQGIAKALYGLALLPKPEGLGLTLVSDASQTPGGARNWLSLSQIPGVEVTGLVIVRIPDDPVPKHIAPSYENLINDLLGKIGAVYHSESEYYYFYEIPVDLVGEKLENIIKNSHIKIYPKGVVIGHGTLLMAKYSGIDSVDEAKKRKRKKSRIPRSITTGWWSGYYGDNSSGGDGGGGE